MKSANRHSDSRIDPSIIPFALVLLLLIAPVAAQDVRDDAPHEAAQPRSAWTETIHGIRATAFAVQKRVPIGQSAHMVVLFQNVSDEVVTIPAVDLMPTVALGLDDHPYEVGHSYNAIVVQSVPGAIVLPFWARMGHRRALMMPVSLQPAALLALNITFSPTFEAVVESLEEERPAQPSDVLVQHRQSQLLMAYNPSLQDLEFVFRPTGFHEADDQEKPVDERWRDVEFRLPPVRIEIYDPEQPQQLMPAQE